MIYPGRRRSRRPPRLSPTFNFTSGGVFFDLFLISLSSRLTVASIRVYLHQRYVGTPRHLQFYTTDMNNLRYSTLTGNLFHNGRPGPTLSTSNALFVEATVIFTNTNRNIGRRYVYTHILASWSLWARNHALIMSHQRLFRAGLIGRGLDV